MTKQIPYDSAFNKLCGWLYPTVWYHIGGNTKDGGVDCSGLVDNWWEEIGFWPVGQDATADRMFDNLAGRIADRPIGLGTKLEVPQFGGLCFYGTNSDYAGHVTIAISSEYCVGATGGYESTDTVAEAKALDAKVKIHKIRYRDDYHGCWMPDYEFIGGPAAPTQNPVIDKYKVTTRINFRSAPSTSGAVIGALDSGTIVTEVDGVLPVVADGYTWLNVSVNETIGWVASKYLELQ